MDNAEKESPIPENQIFSQETESNSKIIKSKKYDLLLLNDEFQLTIDLKNSFLEFKLQQKDIINNFIYKSNFDLITLNKLLSTNFIQLKDAFYFLDNELNEKMVKLVQSKEKHIINLNFKNNTNSDNPDKSLETNLELKQYNLTKDELIFILREEINSLKKKLNSKNEIEELLKIKENNLKEYINLKIEESKNELIDEYKKTLEYTIKEKDNVTKILKESMDSIKKELAEKLITPERNQVQKKEEKTNQIIYDQNLLNDLGNFNPLKMQNLGIIANNLEINFMRSVAVFQILRNNTVSYEIAFPENKNGFNIMICDIILIRITKIIKNAHKDEIIRIKYYFYDKEKMPILLTSSRDKSIKLWNMSSNSISNLTTIENFFDGDIHSPIGLMFNNNDFFILGGSRNKKKNIYNKNGALIRQIENSALDYGCFIESANINDKSYVLLSGRNHSECYDYEKNNINIYKSKNKSKEHNIAILFRNNSKYYLICRDEGGIVTIFDFIYVQEIYSIQVGWHIYSLCSVNEKYILVGYDNKGIQVIDFDHKKNIITYKSHKNFVYGIEKLKVNMSDIYIVSYDRNEIQLWK